MRYIYKARWENDQSGTLESSQQVPALTRKLRAEKFLVFLSLARNPWTQLALKQKGENSRSWVLLK